MGLSIRTSPSARGANAASPADTAGFGAAATTVGSTVRRTLTRMPSSSIVISPIPVSWTMRTTSRMRSARSWSTPPAASDSSPDERWRTERSSGSASSPKSASRSSSSSLDARPCASSRSSSRFSACPSVAPP